MATTTTRFALSKPASGDNVSSFQGTIGTTLDTIDLDMVGLQGAYAAGTTYHQGDVVTSSGIYYMSTATQTGVAPPGATWIQQGGVFVSSADAFVATSQTTTSTTFTDLATSGPAVTVTVTATGKIRVTVSANMSNNTAGDGAAMTVALSGANTVAAASAPANLFYSQPTGVSGIAMGNTFIMSGLSAGSTTVTCKYEAVTGGTATFINRQLIVDVYA